jgi:outer membrane receptor protein involved in Fe transport
LDESANLTLVRSKYNTDGVAVAYVPGAVLRSDTAVFRELPLAAAGEKFRGTIGLGLSYVGPRPLPYGQKSQSIFTTDASATLTWTHYELGLTVVNLFDARYRLGEYNYPSSWPDQSAASQPTLVPMRQFTAGAPRAFYVTFGINFGGTP